MAEYAMVHHFDPNDNGGTHTTWIITRDEDYPEDEITRAQRFDTAGEALDALARDALYLTSQDAFEFEQLRESELQSGRRYFDECPDDVDNYNWQTGDHLVTSI